MARITIEVNEQQRQQIKVMATLNNMMLKDFILDSTIAMQPNSETLKFY